MRRAKRRPYSAVEHVCRGTVNTLPVLEARASSEIENIVTTADRLFRFAQDDQLHPSTCSPSSSTGSRTDHAQGTLAAGPVTKQCLEKRAVDRILGPVRLLGADQCAWARDWHSDAFQIVRLRIGDDVGIGQSTGATQIDDDFVDDADDTVLAPKGRGT